MEEEKKEECCVAGKFHHCCWRKPIHLVLLALAVLAIFSLGVWFGSCENYNRGEGRGERQFNFEQRDGRGMMNNKDGVGGCRMQNEEINISDGGCPMKNGSGAGQAVGGCAMQNQTATTVAPTATSVKPVTPIK